MEQKQKMPWEKQEVVIEVPESAEAPTACDGLVDRYMEAEGKLAELYESLHTTAKPFNDDILEIQANMTAAVEDIKKEIRLHEDEQAQIKREMEKAMGDEKEVMFSGSGRNITLRKSYTRSVEAEKLYGILDKEGLLPTMGHIFKHTTTLSEVLPLTKMPLFPKEGLECITSKQRGATKLIVG